MLLDHLYLDRPLDRDYPAGAPIREVTPADDVVVDARGRTIINGIDGSFFIIKWRSQCEGSHADSTVTTNTRGFCWRICLGDSRALQPFFFGGGFGVCNQVCNELREVCNPSVFTYGKSVTRSEMRCFIGLQIPTLIFSELVTDADTDTDFNVFELDM